MSGTLISLAAQPSPLGNEANSDPLVSHLSLPSIRICPKIYTASHDSAYVINDQTLSPGDQITVDGTIVSIAPQASAMVVGGNSELLVQSHALPIIKIGPKVYTANQDSAYTINVKP